MDFLNENQLDENRLVIYVCDNGWIANPNPANGGAVLPRSKQSPYDMGIRSPIMYKWPSIINPRMDTSTFVNSIDIVPTILNVIGIEKTKNIHGVNVLNEQALHGRKAVFS